ncbi:MAG: glycosyltransferase family 2 protein [Thermodesulfobacteriota bacterium]|nr:glycosyltransferase family 2 protein [Thermodesulfobacteriota bacterium]
MCNDHCSVALVIVNWNSGDWLRRCLHGLACQTVQPERVLLVDNYSTDSSLAGIEEILPTVEIIRETENLGFAKANNIALGGIVNSQWTVLLNPDAVPEPDWLENLIHATQNHLDYTFFACKMLDATEPSLLDGTGDVYHTSGHAWRQGFGRDSQIEGEVTAECFSPCAAAAMYRTDILKQVAGFDERFFCYFEDVDLGFRLRLLGHRCLYVPEAVVAHAGSASTMKRSNFSVYYGHRNMIWTYFKNMPWPLFWIYLPQHILLNVVSVFVLSLRGQGRVAFCAKYDAIKSLRYVLKDRRLIQKNRQVSFLDLRRSMSKGVGQLLERN